LRGAATLSASAMGTESAADPTLDTEDDDSDDDNDDPDGTAGPALVS
jgi:hypothetical protein